MHDSGVHNDRILIIDDDQGIHEKCLMTPAGSNDSAELSSNDILRLRTARSDVPEAARLAAGVTRKSDIERHLQKRMDEMAELVAARTNELQEARDDSEQLLNAISSLLVKVDTEFIVRRWNSRAEELFDIPSDQALGVRFIDLPINWVDAAQAESLVDCENSNCVWKISNWPDV